MKIKPIVEYVVQDAFIKVNFLASIRTYGHPSADRVSQGDWAITSRVISYDEETGVFETVNTVYVPMAV